MCERYAYTWRQGEGAFPFLCNTWKCPECEPAKRKAIVAITTLWAEKYDLRRAVTLTLNPATVTSAALARFFPGGEEQAAELMETCRKHVWRSGKKGAVGRLVLSYTGGSADDRRDLRQAMNRYLNYIFNKARTRLKRLYPHEYIRVTELHKDSVRPHCHLLVSRYIPQAVWKRVWEAAGGGWNVDVRYIKGRVQEAAAYIMKYLTKATQAPAASWPYRSRRIVVSRALSLSLNPDEKAIYEAYIASDITPESPCIGGFTPESLEGEKNEQCSGCIWKKRRICRWKPPGVEPWILYDKRGMQMFELSVPWEEQHKKLLLWLCRAVQRWRLPYWAKGDAIAESMAKDMAQDAYTDLVIPFDVDPSCELHYLIPEETEAALCSIC